MKPPETEKWPTEELEARRQCPVCWDTERQLMYQNLTDTVFRCAPGEWRMYKCCGCGCGYLDPRPSRASIFLAYQSYFTHEQKDSGARDSGSGLARELRRRLAEGYANRRYGAVYPSALSFGDLLARLMPVLRRKIDARFRYLPRSSPGSRLLDVGCGNGEFMLLARDAGWEVEGVDSDPKVIANARGKGLTVVQSSGEQMPFEERRYDIVTMNHVIEHLHDPVATLAAARNLLKPAGTLYLETPNLESAGHAYFGRYWRGLEVPRHLVLFVGHALEETLIKVGFRSITLIKRPEVALQMYPKSVLLMRGLDPYSKPFPRNGMAAFRAYVAGALDPKQLEYITVVARA